MRGLAVALLAVSGCTGPGAVRPLPPPSVGSSPSFLVSGGWCAPIRTAAIAPGAWRETLTFERSRSPPFVWSTSRTLVIGPGQRAAVTLETDGFRGRLVLSDRLGATTSPVRVGQPVGRTLALDAPPGAWSLSITGAEGRGASLSVVVEGSEVPWVAACQPSPLAPVGLSDAVRAALFEDLYYPTSRSQREITARTLATAYTIEAGDGGLLGIDVRDEPFAMSRRHEVALLDAAGRAWPLTAPVPAAPGSLWSVVVAGSSPVVAFGARAIRPTSVADVLARLDTAAVLAAPVQARHRLPPGAL